MFVYNFPKKLLTFIYIHGIIITMKDKRTKQKNPLVKSITQNADNVKYKNRLDKLRGKK